MKELDYYQTVNMAYPKRDDFISFQVNFVKGGLAFDKLSKDELTAKGFSYISERKGVDVQKLDSIDYVVIFNMDEQGYKYQSRVAKIDHFFYGDAFFYSKKEKEVLIGCISKIDDYYNRKYLNIIYIDRNLSKQAQKESVEFSVL